HPQLRQRLPIRANQLRRQIPSRPIRRLSLVQRIRSRTSNRHHPHIRIRDVTRRQRSINRLLQHAAMTPHSLPTSRFHLLLCSHHVHLPSSVQVRALPAKLPPNCPPLTKK